MSIESIQTEVQIREIMNSPAVTIERDKTVLEAAKLMKTSDVGGIVVMGQDKPVGILTRTDIIERLLADERDPRETRVDDIMSSPIITVDASTSVQDASKLMRNRRISRLAVLYKDKLVGMVSMRDLVRVTPEIIDILSEKAMIEKGVLVSKSSSPITGYCDNCGEWSDSLKETEGKYFCPDCVVDLYR
jgi:CBS domain-containing protein